MSERDTSLFRRDALLGGRGGESIPVLDEVVMEGAVGDEPEAPGPSPVVSPEHMRRMEQAVVAALEARIAPQVTRMMDESLGALLATFQAEIVGMVRDAIHAEVARQLAGKKKL